jgi:triosephosphate isomerase
MPLLAGNWKMHGTVETATDLTGRIIDGRSAQSLPNMLLFVPFVHIPAVANKLQGIPGIEVGAQNVSAHGSGAYTGEVSAAMLLDLGCRYVIVGHSERRHLFAETSSVVAKKFAIAQEAGLTPVLCVGETLQQRRHGHTSKVVSEQIVAVSEIVGMQGVCRAIIAYEPVWAIGTGETPSPQEVQQVHSEIRTQLGVNGSATPLLYGGSVNSNNAAVLFDQPDVDGGLVGGASLQAQEFLKIAQHMIEP